MELKHMLELVDQPAFLTDGETVVWRNRAARQLVLDGHRVSSLLGGGTLPTETTRLTVTLPSGAYEATVEPYGEQTLFLLSKPAEPDTEAGSACLWVSALLRSTLHDMTSVTAPLFDAAQGEPQAEKAACAVNHAIYRLLRLSIQLADGSRLLTDGDPTHRTALDLRAWAEDFAAHASPLVESLGMRLRCELPRKPLPVHADGALLERAMYNLLANALKHMSAGGTVTLRVYPEGEQCVMQLIDDGSGLAPEILSVLFSHKGEVTPESGMIGLGAALAQRIAALHGGQLRIAPRTDAQGVVATFSLSTRPLTLSLHDCALHVDHYTGRDHGLTELSTVLPSREFDPMQVE